jgi:hypothetical protein
MAEGDHTPTQGPLGAGAGGEGTPATDGPQMGNVLAGLPRVRPGRRAQRRAAAPGTGASDEPKARASASPARSSAPKAPPKTRAGAKPKAAAKAGAKAKPKAAAKPAVRPKAVAKATAAKPKVAGKAKAAAEPKAASGRRPASVRQAQQETPEVPRQGFETEDTRHGDPIQPPSRAEVAGSLIEAAADGLEELVKAGAGAGGAALKRALGLISNR